MIRTFWVAATGMGSQQLNLDVIANNLANVNTVGFKKSRADFEELLYQEERLPGAASSPDTQYPTGLAVGLGVRPVATQKIFSEGNMEQTANSLDLAIEGDGFFKILMPNGEFAYTRNGSFKLDRDGKIVTPTGFAMDPEIIDTGRHEKHNDQLRRDRFRHTEWLRHPHGGWKHRTGEVHQPGRTAAHGPEYVRAHRGLGR